MNEPDRHSTRRERRFALGAAAAVALLVITVLVIDARSAETPYWRAKLEAWLASPEFAAAALPAPPRLVPPDDAAAILDGLRDPSRRTLLRCSVQSRFPDRVAEPAEFEELYTGVVELLQGGSTTPERRVRIESWINDTRADLAILVRAARARNWSRDAAELHSSDAMRARRGIARQVAWQFHVRAALAGESGEHEFALAIVEASFAFAALDGESCTLFDWLLHLQHERECLQALARLRRDLGAEADLRRFARFLEPRPSRHRAARALRREIVLMLTTAGVLENGRIAGPPRHSETVDRLRGMISGHRDFARALSIYDEFLTAFDSEETDPFSALPSEAALERELPSGAFFSATAVATAARMAKVQAELETLQRAAAAQLAPKSK